MNNYNRFDVNNLVTIRTLSSSQWKETMQCRAKSSAFNKKKLILKQYKFKDNVSLQLHTLQQRYKNKMTQNESTIINVVIQKKDGQTILNIIEEYQEHENISKYINPNWIFQIELLIKLVEQLSNLHQQQIYHLNLKPQNILINCKSDQYLFTDFNYPQLIYAYQLSQYRFSSIYMPPQGRQTYLLDGSADIWSLGIIFLEIILKHRIETVSTEDGSNLLESVKRIIAKVKDVNWRKLIEGMCRPFEERYTLEEVHQNLLNIKQRKNVNPPKIKILLPIFPFNDVKIKCNEDMLSDWFSSKRQIKQFQISLFLQKKDGSQVLYFCIKHLQSGIIIANTVYNQLPFASREHFEDIDSLYQQIINTDTNNLDFDSGGFISIRITNKSASQNESDAQTSKINEKEQLFQQQKQIFDKPQPQYNKESVQSQQISQLEKKPMNSSSINNKKIQDQSANQIQNAKDEQLQQLQQIEQLSDEEQTIEQQIKLLPGTNDQIKQTIKNLRIAYRLNEKYDLIPYYFEKLAFMYKEINDRSSAKFAFKFAKRLYFLYTKKREVAEVIMNLGIIYIQMQQSDKAINCFKLLIKYAKQCSISLQQPHYTTVAITGYKQLAKLYLLIQRYKLSQQCCIKSISLLDQALDNYKEDIQQIYIILSQLYFKSNSYTEAVESIQGALSYLNKQQKQVDLQAKLRYNLAFCYFSQGNIRQCLMKYCEMLQFAKKNKIEDSYQLQFIQFMRENYAQFNSIYKQNDESITSIKRILKRENAIKLQLILQKNDL